MWPLGTGRAHPGGFGKDVAGLTFTLRDGNLHEGMRLPQKPEEGGWARKPT